MTNTDWQLAYDKIDRYLRNNLDDSDYEEYSQSLEAVLFAFKKEPDAAAPGAAPSLPEDQPSGRTYKDVDELFSAMGIPPSSGGSDEQIARRLVAWDDSGNTQGEHHETLREIINSARAALSKASPPSDRQEGGQA